MQNNANRGDKKQRKATERENQQRNKANKRIITPKASALLPWIKWYACTLNHDNQFGIVNCLNNLYDIHNNLIKCC